MPVIYNNHTHIFNVECIPEGLMPMKLVRVMSENKYSHMLLRTLTFFSYKSDFMKKQAAFLKYHTEDWQEAIFRNLQSVYPKGTKFVVLTMDMDFMGAGRAERNYISQLTEIASLKRMYPNELLPFVAVDPRRGTAEQNRDFVKKWVEEYGFAGIKMYPPLGFFPDDERLDLVYDYAVQNELPILTHCSKDGGIYYKGKFQSEWLRNVSWQTERLRESKMKTFRNNFMHPANYDAVFTKHPGVKICLAHYGGDAELLSSGKDAWGKIIRKQMKDYVNAYADISYTLYNRSVFNIFQQDISSKDTGHKILFGTDFYMTEREKEEHILKDELRNVIGEASFEKISNKNVKEFLRSKIYGF